MACAAAKDLAEYMRAHVDNWTGLEWTEDDQKILDELVEKAAKFDAMPPYFQDKPPF